MKKIEPSNKGSRRRAELRAMQVTSNHLLRPKPTICERCGIEAKLDRLHPDYSKPNEVIWMCRPCHAKEHHRVQAKYGAPAAVAFVMAGGRRRRVFRLTRRGNFHVRFQVRGKDRLRSTGTTVESAAKERAREIVEAEINGQLRERRDLKSPFSFALEVQWQLSELRDRIAALEQKVGGAQ